MRRKSEREATVRDIVESACKQLPKNFPRDLVTRYRLEVERRLSMGIKRARKSGGLDFYLPMADPGESPIAASFVVGEISTEGDPSRFLGVMTSTGGYEAVTIDEAPGARREVVAEADVQEGIELASRRVDYVAAVPGDRRRWLTISFSTMGGGDPNDELSDATVSLFDAIVTTFRWSSE
ncbi:hypothetical protein GCM10010228_42390 [Streptomyces massasporeus]|nr:hypothetical protein GCM10010228_42390 [Streptomyces massasporeus]